MGCNAWNHPPNCNCGWGGAGYLESNGEDSWLFNKDKKRRSLGYQKATSGTLASGYTDPNATCPICGAAVYFYESPYGGRIFFDDLGPPWPKHPCTANEASGIKGVGGSWCENGWNALSEVFIEVSQQDKDLYTIRGKDGSSSRQFYFLSKQPIVADVVRYKSTEQLGAFLLSLLYYDPSTNSWNTVDITAYTSGHITLEQGKFANLHRILIIKEKKPIDKTKKPYKPEEVESTKKSKSFRCPWCSYKRKVGLSAIVTHILDKHGFIALGSIDKITGAIISQNIESSKHTFLKQMERLESHRFKKIEESAIDLFNGDKNKANKWMTTPNKYISMLTPADRIKNDNQLNSILKLIERLKTKNKDQ